MSEQMFDTKEEKKEFLSKISHEMRTPMSAITAFSQLALQSDNLGEIKDYLRNVLKSSDILMQIINQNLDGISEEELFMPDGGQMEQFDLIDEPVLDKIDSGAPILVVDDNKVNLKVACAMLVQYGFCPETASSGEEAIIKASGNAYRAVFMDYRMPNINGAQTMLLIKEAQPDYRNVPFIALTADAVKGAKEKMIEEGFDDYLSKPIYRNQLEQILVEWLPAPIHGVNMQIGIENCGGELEIYQSILQFILENKEERILKLNKLKEEKDYENYTIEVHALKSTLANIGAMRQSELAKTLEMAGKEGKYEVVENRHEELIWELEKVLNSLEVYLERGEKERKKDISGEARESMAAPFHEKMEEAETITEDEVNVLLGDVLQLLLDFKYDEAENVMQELSEFQMEEGLFHLILDIKKEISSFHVEEAIQKIKAFLA